MNNMMKLLSVMALSLMFQFCHAQRTHNSTRDSLAGAFVQDILDIREQLVNLAIQNSGRGIDSANRNIAEYNLNKAKSSWYNQISVAGNINEFSLTNSTVASYYPGIILELQFLLAFLALMVMMLRLPESKYILLI